MKLILLGLVGFILTIFAASKFLTFLDANLVRDSSAPKLVTIAPSLPNDVIHNTLTEPVNSALKESALHTEPAVGVAMPGETKLVNLGDPIDPDAAYVIQETNIPLINLGPVIDPDSQDVLLTSVSLVNVGDLFDVDAYLDNLEGASVLEEIGDEIDPESL